MIDLNVCLIDSVCLGFPNYDNRTTQFIRDRFYPGIELVKCLSISFDVRGALLFVSRVVPHASYPVECFSVQPGSV